MAADRRIHAGGSFRIGSLYLRPWSRLLLKQSAEGQTSAFGPALCPELTYDDLEDIADGLAASAAFLQLAAGGLTDPQEIDRVRSALRVSASAIRSPWSSA